MSNLAESIRRPNQTHPIEITAPTSRTFNPGEFLTDAIYPSLVRFLTGMLIVALCLWMLAGVTHILANLREVFVAGWATMAEQVIIKTLIMLALLEVIRTLQAYLKLGRVRVTFILDTALVVLIGELMGLWFKEYAPKKVLLGLGVIVTPVALRIVTARFSPETAGDVH